MKSLAIYVTVVPSPGGPAALQGGDFFTACRHQADLLAADDDFVVEILRSDNPQDKEKAASGTYDFIIHVDSRLQLADKAFSIMLENSAFVNDKAIMVASVAGPDGKVVYGGRSKNGKLIQPDPVIPVPCRIYDEMFYLVPRQAPSQHPQRLSLVMAPGILATCGEDAMPLPEKVPFWRKISLLRRIVDFLNE